MIELLRQNIRIAALVLVVVLLVVVIIVFYLQLQSAEGDREDLMKDKTIAELEHMRTSVDYDLATLQARMDGLSGKPEFPTKLPVVDLSHYLARGEDLFRVDIVEIGPFPVGVKTIGGKSYPAYETKVAVTGELTDIISFLEYVEGGRYTSIMVEGVKFSGSEGSWTGIFTIVFITQG